MQRGNWGHSPFYWYKRLNGDGFYDKVAKKIKLYLLRIIIIDLSSIDEAAAKARFISPQKKTSAIQY